MRKTMTKRRNDKIWQEIINFKVQDRVASIGDFVNRYKNRSSLFIWGVGNEVENSAPWNTTAAFEAVEIAARAVRKADPNHPTMAVLAEIGSNKVALLKRLAPSIQVLLLA